MSYFLAIVCTIALLYGHYRLCKWLTYDFFTTTPEKTGDWVDDYLIVYGKKTLGVILLLPFALTVIAVFLFAIIANSNRPGSYGLFGSSRSNGDFRIQYRRHGTWIDGPGSNNEAIAESMFDNFVNNDPRGQNRCRLVRVVNGRVEQVVSTN